MLLSFAGPQKSLRVFWTIAARCLDSNGLSFVPFKTVLIKWCEEMGISHQTSIIYTPQQNCVAGRHIRGVKEMTNCLIKHPFQEQIMGHACVYASLILNHTWKKFSGATPSAKTFGKVSSVQTFRVWGAVACARIHQPQPQGPFDARGVNSCFVVLNITSKGYKLAWWPEVFPKFRELTICRRIHR